MIEDKGIEKDEFGRILCPKCKKPYYWIKGEMCSDCLFKEKGITNKKEYEDSLISQGSLSKEKEMLDKFEKMIDEMPIGILSDFQKEELKQKLKGDEK